MPQVPVLLKRKGLSGDWDWPDTYYTYDYSVDPVFTVDEGYVYAPINIEPDSYENAIYVNENGDTVDSDGNVLIRADEVVDAVTMAESSPEAVARVLSQTSPSWAAQFRNTDDLIRAAAGLVSTVKAAVSGKPIPPAPGSPGVMVRPVSPASRGGAGMGAMFSKIPPAALIGGAALVAFVLLRRKSQ